MSKYYDIDDLLTDAHRIPTVFQLSVPGMGYLESGRNESTDIVEGARIELPLWMADLLAIGGISDDLPTGFVTVSTPAPLSSRVVSALKADAGSVDLRAQSLQFHRLALRWLSMAGDEKLLEAMMETLKARAALINDFAHNTRGGSMMFDNTEFVSKLDEFEMKLFKTSHDSSRDFKKWLSTKK
ncbi:DNA replication complex GINS protein-like protein psf3 [Limtongia smithiae]|uniref:DNA replication complex GINS protein-like protein psf3 n=1 Tax=Limtongia smithiae TaxID=1125753 RepID=UPI0034CE5FC2